MKQTPLHALHLEQNAKMAEFAGYDMPIQYPDGVMTEHNWTREHAGIFDVSHMGQLIFEGEGVAKFLESLTPSTFSTLKDNVAKYSVLMNQSGGMIDDLIATKLSDTKFFVVVNGACKDVDIAWFKQHLPDGITLTHLTDRALIAIQGPAAEKVLREALDIETSDLNYMRFMEFGGRCWVSRLGYTGEDGFEISMPATDAETAWNRLMNHADVKAIGLAARDSLRLEMGYPLYGHDIDATTSPVEADVTWIMGKRENKDFIGAERVFDELENGAPRKRVGIRLTGKGVAREGAEVYDTTGQNKIGTLTSGGFSPTLQQAIGMAYIETPAAIEGAKISVRVRGRDIEGEIAALPFVEAKTKKSVKSSSANAA